MLRISCPLCGERDEVEFQFGGESHIERPEINVSDAGWSDYLFLRTNPKGLHFERWCHKYGCGQWFNVARNTVTNEIYAVYRMGDPKPIVDVEPSGSEKRKA